LGINIEKVRNDTPGVGKVIHLNNAGASLATNQVVNAIAQYMNEELLYGGYETMTKNAESLNTFYVKTAEWINAYPYEIAFTDSATTAWQRAFFSIPWKNGDEIITCVAEYASNYISYLRLKKWFNIKIIVAQDNEFGEVSTLSIEKLITSKTKLIAITHMPTLSGLVNPVEEIGKIAKLHEVFYMVDACQSVGQYPLDVEKIQCDFLSGTGRKFMRGPRGTGFLYVNKDIIQQLDPLSVDLFSAHWMDNETYKMRKDAIRFEQFESNLSLKMGLTAAIDYQLELGMENIWKRVTTLGDYLRNKLKEVDQVKVIDTGRVKSGIVCMEINNHDVFRLMDIMVVKGINVSAASVYNSRLFMEKYNHTEALRASVHYYNTEKEIDVFVEELGKLINR